MHTEFCWKRWNFQNIAISPKIFRLGQSFIIKYKTSWNLSSESLKTVQMLWAVKEAWRFFETHDISIFLIGFSDIWLIKTWPAQWLECDFLYFTAGIMWYIWSRFLLAMLSLLLYRSTEPMRVVMIWWVSMMTQIIL